MMKRSHSHLPRAALATLVFALALSGAAQAVTCSINATGAVAFGAYDSTSGPPTDSAGTITYTCNGNPGPNFVSLSPGASGTYTPRTMVSGGNTLRYNLYTDAARTVIWGDGNGGTQTVGHPPIGTNVVLQIYGRIPAGQNVPAGSYSDTITVTIDF